MDKKSVPFCDIIVHMEGSYITQISSKTEFEERILSNKKYSVFDKIDIPICTYKREQLFMRVYTFPKVVS